MALSMKRIISGAQLGDLRRNDRLFELVQWLTRQATAGAGSPGVGGAWAESMGAWRFFNNAEISLDAAYSVVRSAIRESLGASKRCYVMHDVSLIDLSRHNSKADRIPIGDHRGAGYELYSALVVDQAGHAIGPVFQEVRVEGGVHSSEPLTKREAKRGVAKFIGHIEQMEKAVVAARSHLEGLRRVHIADREFDDLAAMRAWVGNDDEYIVRVQHKTRRVLFNGEHMALEEACAAAKLSRSGNVEKQGKSYNRWQGEIEVTLDGLSRRGRHRGQTPKAGDPITVRVVVVELRAAHEETIRWMLVTNSNDSIEQVVQAYVWRWEIERYFYLTKVGFKLESWLQQTGEAFARKLAAASLAAMVVYQLVAITDEDPERARAIQTIASMGGWLGRKRDPIGPIVLMRGITALLNMMAAIQQLGVTGVRELANQVLPDLIAKPGARRGRGDV